MEAPRAMATKARPSGAAEGGGRLLMSAKLWIGKTWDLPPGGISGRRVSARPAALHWEEEAAMNQRLVNEHSFKPSWELVGVIRPCLRPEETLGPSVN